MHSLFSNVFADSDKEKKQKDEKIRVPSWKSGENYTVGDHIRFRGKVYECLVDHESSRSDVPSKSTTNWSLVPDDTTKPLLTTYDEADSGDELEDDGMV